LDLVSISYTILLLALTHLFITFGLSSMKISYIILAHRYPLQLSRLISKLYIPNVTSFFIHIDNKIDITPFKEALFCFPEMQQNIFWVERERSRWGDLGLVLASINGIKIANQIISPDYYILLSGQDYPIKSNQYILQFLSENEGKSFIDYFDPESISWRELWYDRITRYYVNYKDARLQVPPRQKQDKLKYKLLYWILGMLYSKKRKLPSFVKKVYGGFQWWMLHRTHIEELLVFMNTNQYIEYIKFHKYSFIPDEMFFQMILLNSDNSELKSKIVNNSMRYVDWDKPHPPYPAIIKVEDFDKLKSSDKLFARKLDETIDDKILDLIDNELLGLTTNI